MAIIYQEREQGYGDPYKEPLPSSKPPAFEIHTVDKKLHLKTYEALVESGLTFVTPIKSISVSELKANKETAPLIGRMGYICSSEEMQPTAPPEIVVAINPNDFRIKKSNDLSTTKQIKKIEEQEAILKKKLPKDVRDVISVLKPPKPSILIQLDLAYQRQKREVLFTDWVGRTDQQTLANPPITAVVGRNHPEDQLVVGDWRSALPNPHVYAVFVVVLPLIA
ncbi:MAG: hypothetical protein HY424_01335 [Candidatus Levybacteria bacterium]|nr:hypothetical protein [Candidatus Levybacteria bacterium]